MPLFRRPSERIGIVGGVPPPGEAAVSGHGFVAVRRRFGGSALHRIASGYVAFQVDVVRVTGGEEVGRHIMNVTT